MKRLWISVAILAGIFTAALANHWYLDRLTGTLTDGLRAAQTCAEAGDWAEAARLTGQVQQRWQDSEGYLYVVLRHDETDGVATGLKEVRQLLEWGEAAEYTSANAKLVENIRLLAEMEAFNLKNLL